MLLLLLVLPLALSFPGYEHQVPSPAAINGMAPYPTMFLDPRSPASNNPQYYWATHESRGNLGGVARRSGTNDRVGGNLGHHYGCWPLCKVPFQKAMDQLFFSTPLPTMHPKNPFA